MRRRTRRVPDRVGRRTRKDPARIRRRTRHEPEYESEAGDVMSPDPAGDQQSTRHRLSPARVLDVDPLIDDPQTRIVVCCGSGGVGKTTTAAALGLRAAERGRKVVVLTIDPARRLAQSLGLEELGNEPRTVPGALRDAGGPGRGELQAMMLDMRRTFDEM